MHTEEQIRCLAAALDEISKCSIAGYAITSKATRDVLSERVRQIRNEGYGEEHDDSHQRGQIARAGACYAYWAGQGFVEKDVLANMWPWEIESCKRKDFRRDLVRAAALILAEIERFDRQDPGRPVPPHGSGP